MQKGQFFSSFIEKIVSGLSRLTRSFVFDKLIYCFIVLSSLDWKGFQRNNLDAWVILLSVLKTSQGLQIILIQVKVIISLSNYLFSTFWFLLIIISYCKAEINERHLPIYIYRLILEHSPRLIRDLVVKGKTESKQVHILNLSVTYLWPLSPHVCPFGRSVGW